MQLLLTGKQRLPGYSGEWEVKKLGEITLSISSGKSKLKSVMGKYQVYGSTGIIGYYDNYDYQGKKILVARVGANAGKINIVEGQYCVSDNTLIIDLLLDNNIDFFRFQLEQHNLNTLTFGSGQPLITGNQLKNLLVFLPPLEEQKAIARILSDMDEEIEVLEQKRNKYQDIKKGMMQELLTGKTRLV
jgi:type I restriction enzyme S subunit